MTRKCETNRWKIVFWRKTNFLSLSAHVKIFWASQDLWREIQKLTEISWSGAAGLTILLPWIVEQLITKNTPPYRVSCFVKQQQGLATVCPDSSRCSPRLQQPWQNFFFWYWRGVLEENCFLDAIFTKNFYLLEQNLSRNGNIIKSVVIKII